MKVSKDRYKSYVDKDRVHREFQVGGKVFLKVKVIKISLQLGNCKKLAVILCGLFELLSIIEAVDYDIAQPRLVKVHNVFHVSLLKKYVYDSNHILDWSMMQVEPKRKSKYIQYAY